MIKKISLLLFLSSVYSAYSQSEFVMSGQNTFSVTNAVFYDDGGEIGNVGNDTSITTFIGINSVEIYFTDFNIPYDAILNIYSGESTSGELVGSFRSHDKPWNYKAKSITIEYIPSPTGASGRGWRGIVKENNVFKPDQVLATQPESDCPNAIPLCSNSTVVVSSAQYVNTGNINDDSGGCYGGTGSGGSVWYSFTPQATGPLDFLIIPTGSTDYDFVLWDITGGCSSKTEVLCNYSATHGSTGAASGGASASEGSGGSLLCTRPTVTLGRTYAICINFYGGSNDGYTLSFKNEASSVNILDNTPPTITNVIGNGCTNTTVLDVYFSEWINCTTLQASDFTMPGETFTMIADNCVNGKTNHVQISVSPALTATSGTPTNYNLSVLNSGAGTSMTDMCGNPMNQTFVVTLGVVPTANAGPDKYNCKSPGFFGTFNYSSVTLSGSGGSAGSFYFWSDGSTGASPSVSPTQTTNYTLTVTQGACAATDVMTVFTEVKPTVNLGPDITMCTGFPLSMSTSGGGTYQWQVQTGSGFFGPTMSNIAGATSSSYSTVPVQYAATGATYYQVNVVSPNGACTASDQIKITFGSGVFSIAADKTFLCQGQSVTLSMPSGMTAYNWSTGTSANSPLVVNPSTTTSYTVTSTTVGCTGTASITIPVRPIQSVAASALPNMACAGTPVNLAATPSNANSTVTDNFESANGFTLVNGTYNKWYWGTAAFCNGSKGLYIGTTAANNSYSVVSGLTSMAATNHAYKDYSITSYCNASLSFNWKCGGNTSASLKVWIVPNTFIPAAGTAITASATNSLVGTYYGTTASCTTVTVDLSPYATQTVRVVFSWANTGGLFATAAAPPAASIDDIVFTESTNYSYNWSASSGGLSATSQSVIVNPSSATDYSVTVTRCDGCVANNVVSVAACVVLPIELLSFSAECKNFERVIRWTTVSEKENDYFIIQKSTDAYNWIELTKVYSTGNTNTIKNYDFIDADQTNHVVYYRIAQVDKNQNFEILKTIELSCESKGMSINYYPNPMNDILMINMKNIFGNSATINIYNALGQKVKDVFLTGQNGLNAQHQIDCSLFADGIYTIHFETNTFSDIQKIIKTH